jgi:hypothetical protein
MITLPAVQGVVPNFLETGDLSFEISLLPKKKSMALCPQIVATLAVLLIAAVLPGKTDGQTLSTPESNAGVLGLMLATGRKEAHAHCSAFARNTCAGEGADVEATPQPADDSTGNNTAIVYEGEEKVMVELLETWKTHTWPKPDNISSPLQHCAWDGVGCNDQGEVTRIRLTVKDIEGTIPASIGQLEQLEQLYLYSNSIRGMHSEKCSLLCLHIENSLGR